VKARELFATMLGRSGSRRRPTAIAAGLALVALALPAAAVAECPNEAIRKAQHATNLADCRAWEMVSPVDKNGGEVLANGTTAIASTSGDALAFSSLAGFADTAGSAAGGPTNYLADRFPTGWTTHAVTPTPNPLAYQILYAVTRTDMFSEDLSHAITSAYDLPGVENDTPERKNMYLEDTGTRALEPISISQTGEGDPVVYGQEEFLGGSNPYFWGASADLEHVTWVSSTQLLPADVAAGYPNNGSPNVYSWDEGTLHLAGILPDGMVPPEGSTFTEAEPEVGSTYRNQMSADGSRQIFESPPTGNSQLYLRISHTRTALISESENPAFTGEAEGVHFEGMTPDGRSVFFVTTSPLLSEDESPGPDLYRWTDREESQDKPKLTLITNDGESVFDAGGYGGTLVGMSNDGEIVYYHEFISGTIGAWDHGVKKTISTVPRSASPAHHLTLSAAQPGYARVSENGKFLAYANGGMYLYSLDQDRLHCVSCPGVVSLAPEFGTNGGILIGDRPRYLTNNGRVFFSTEAALLPDDINGVYDVYEYDFSTDSLRLISSGRGNELSMFMDADTTGNNVFFATRQALTASDADAGLDVYDARVGGGFDEPQVADESCSGDACQGASTVTPGAEAPPSSSLEGAGNGKLRPCRSKKRKVAGRHKKPCMRHRHKQQQRSNQTGRTGR